MINLIKNYARQSHDRPQQPLAISPRVNTSTSTTAKALGAVLPAVVKWRVPSSGHHH